MLLSVNAIEPMPAVGETRKPFDLKGIGITLIQVSFFQLQAVFTLSPLAW
jgi:hypothetical protein